jgi:hypothetical protein
MKKLYLISRKDGWAWYVFTGESGTLVARSTASKSTTDAARNAAYRKNAAFKQLPESVFHSTDKLPEWFRSWDTEARKETKGVLYALKHPSFEGLLKVGFTDNSLEDTIRRQSNLLPIPQPFELVDHWEVPDGQSFLRALRKKLKDQHGTEKRSFFRITRPKLKAAVEKALKEASDI